MMLIAVDPGLHTGGVAFFLDGKLVRAEVIKVAEKGANEAAYAKRFAQAVRDLHWSTCVQVKYALDGVLELVCEDQVIYTSRIVKRKHDANPNALLPLANTVGAVEMAFSTWPNSRVEPSNWKGTIDPFVLLERIGTKRLDKWEGHVWESLKKREPKHWDHGGDAVGIGLFRLGRIGRGGVAA